MSRNQAATEALPPGFLAFYEDALSEVYGYLIARCRTVSVAEDLTAETFLAAVDAARRDDPPALSMPWIIGVARHKLVDHWRRLTRESSGLRALSDRSDPDEYEDTSDQKLDAVRSHETLLMLAPHHRTVGFPPWSRRPPQGRGCLLRARTPRTKGSCHKPFAT